MWRSLSSTARSREVLRKVLAYADLHFQVKIQNSCVLKGVISDYLYYKSTCPIHNLGTDNRLPGEFRLLRMRLAQCTRFARSEPSARYGTPYRAFVADLNTKRSIPDNQCVALQTIGIVWDTGIRDWGDGLFFGCCWGYAKHRVSGISKLNTPFCSRAKFVRTFEAGRDDRRRGVFAFRSV